MENRKVRIGFVGVGMMGQNAHLRNYVTLPNCEVTAIAEVRQDTAHKVAAAYGIGKVYADHRDMLAHEQLDGIVSIQQFSRQGILVPELLKAGIPLLTEKPLAGSVAVGEKILRAIKSSGTWMMVGYHKRSDPAAMFAKAEIERLKKTGELGRMTYVRLLMPAGDWVANGNLWQVNGSDPKPELPVDSPAEELNADMNGKYSAFVNYYIHQVNLLRYLLGEPYHLAYTAPSGVMLAVESVGGIDGVIEMSPYQTTVDWQESAFVCFEKGWIKLELPAPLSLNRPGRVTLFRDPGEGAVPEFRSPVLPMEHAMHRQAANFIRAIRGEMSPMCGAEEALEDLKISREYIRMRYGC